MFRLWCIAVVLCGAPGCKGKDKKTETPTPSAANAAKARCSELSSCAKQCEPCEAGECSAEQSRSCFELGQLHLQGEPPQFSLENAAKHFALACERGTLRSCATLGNLVQDGRGVPRDVERATALYTKACDGGVGVGCFNLGGMYMGGVLFDEEGTKAEAFYKKAEPLYQAECDSGRDLSWCPNWGILYEQGYGVKRDLGRAATIYDKACKAGNGDSCVNLGLVDIQDETRRASANPTEILAKFQRLCDEGNRLACGALGALLMRGKHGISPEPERALKLLEKSCTAGHRAACQDLAGYYVARPTPAEHKRAVALMRRSCDLGVAITCLVIAQAAPQKMPGTRPEDEAIYYEKACNIGNGEACGFLGALHYLGRGVPQDNARGVEFTKRSCSLGYPGGCADLMKRKIKLPLPKKRANMMLQSACDSGLQEACSQMQ